MSVSELGELPERLSRYSSALESRYAIYKRRQAACESRIATAKTYAEWLEATLDAAVERGKAHGAGVAITALNLHMNAPLDVEPQIPPTQAGDL